jgi:hypothetical protein
MQIFVYQIYYNEATFSQVMPGFIPLDNRENLRPDLYEFYVMLNYLRNNKLEDNAWYGFLSPNFYEKTGFSSEYVLNSIRTYGGLGNVALFSPGWDQLAYFLNPFEQGDIWHPGLMDISQEFCNTLCNPKTDLKTLVCDTSSSVFSNYIIAKKQFWTEWKKIAELFFDFSEIRLAQQATSYEGSQKLYPMKAFIQERLASLILTTLKFRVISPDQSSSAPIYTSLFSNTPNTRHLLKQCDLLKSKYRQSQDLKYLQMYYQTRSEIPYFK